MVKVYRVVDGCLENLEFVTSFPNLVEFFWSEYCDRIDIVYEEVL